MTAFLSLLGTEGASRTLDSAGTECPRVAVWFAGRRRARGVARTCPPTAGCATRTQASLWARRPRGRDAEKVLLAPAPGCPPRAALARKSQQVRGRHLLPVSAAIATFQRGKLRQRCGHSYSVAARASNPGCPAEVHVTKGHGTPPQGQGGPWQCLTEVTSSRWDTHSLRGTQLWLLCLLPGLTQTLLGSVTPHASRPGS